VKALERDSRLLCGLKVELSWRFMELKLSSSDEEHDSSRLMTGSGKTGAFALPILHALLENPQRYFALVLTPTRELAFQIGEQFEALGKSNLVYLIITKPHNDVKPVLILFSNENVKLLFLYSSLPLS